MDHKEGHPCHQCKKFYETEADASTCRHKKPRTETPPDFWRIDFPESDEISQRKLMLNEDDPLPKSARPNWMKESEKNEVRQKRKTAMESEEHYDKNEESHASRTDSSLSTDHTITDDSILSPPAKKTFYASDCSTTVTSSVVLANNTSSSSLSSSPSSSAQQGRIVSETTATSNSLSEEAVVITKSTANTDADQSTPLVTYDCVVKGNTIMIIKDASSSAIDDTGPDVIIEELSPEESFTEINPMSSTHTSGISHEGMPLDSYAQSHAFHAPSCMLGDNDCQIVDFHKNKPKRKRYTPEHRISKEIDSKSNELQRIRESAASFAGYHSTSKQECMQSHPSLKLESKVKAMQAAQKIKMQKYQRNRSNGAVVVVSDDDSDVEEVVELVSSDEERLSVNTALQASSNLLSSKNSPSKRKLELKATEKSVCLHEKEIDLFQNSKLSSSKKTNESDVHIDRSPIIKDKIDHENIRPVTPSKSSDVSSDANNVSCVTTVNEPNNKSSTETSSDVGNVRASVGEEKMNEDRTQAALENTLDIDQQKSEEQANQNNLSQSGFKEQEKISILFNLDNNTSPNQENSLKTQVLEKPSLSDNNTLVKEPVENADIVDLQKKDINNSKDLPEKTTFVDITPKYIKVNKAKQKKKSRPSTFHLGTAAFVNELNNGSVNKASNKKSKNIVSEDVVSDVSPIKINSLKPSGNEKPPLSKISNAGCSNEEDVTKTSVSHNIVHDVSKDDIQVNIPTPNRQEDSEVESTEKFNQAVERTTEQHINSESFAEYNFQKFEEIGYAIKEFNTTYENHLRGCLWSPDGGSILTNSDDNILRIFPIAEDILNGKLAESQELQATLRMSEGETVYDMDWYPYMDSNNPDTCCFLTTSRDHPVHLWDACIGRVRCSYLAYDHMDELTSATSVAFNNDGSKIYCGFNKIARVFDSSRPGRDFEEIQTATKKHQSRKNKHRFAFNLTQSGIISSIAFPKTYNGLFAMGSYSKTVGLYSLQDNQLVNMLTPDIGGHIGGVTQVQFTADGGYLFSGGRKDCEIICWDMRNTTMPLFKLIRNVNTNQRIQFDVDRSGTYVASGGTDEHINTYDLNKIFENISDEVVSHERTTSFHAHQDVVNAVSLHPTKPLLASTSGQRHFLVDDSSDSDSSSTNVSNTRKFHFDNSLRVWKV